MKIKFKSTESLAETMFFPYGYPKFYMRNGDIKDVPVKVGNKLLREYPQNLSEYIEPEEEKPELEEVSPATKDNPELTYHQKKKIAKEMGYSGKYGWTEAEIDKVINVTK